MIVRSDDSATVRRGISSLRGGSHTANLRRCESAKRRSPIIMPSAAIEVEGIAGVGRPGVVCTVYSVPALPRGPLKMDD